MSASCGLWHHASSCQRDANVHTMPSLTLAPRVKTNESISEWIGARIYFTWCSACRPPPLAAADGDDGDDDGGDDDDGGVAEGLEEFMIRANGGICILLHMSLPNGRLHTEVMIIIEHGAQANCCTTHTHTNHGEEERKWSMGGEEEGGRGTRKEELGEKRWRE